MHKNLNITHLLCALRAIFLKPSIIMQAKSKFNFRARVFPWNKHFNSVCSYHSDISTFLKQTLKNNFPEIKYTIFTPEQGANQAEGDWHFQGYTEFTKPVTIAAFGRRLAQIWNQTPWRSSTDDEYFFSDAQVRKGSRQQAIDYVRKENNFAHRHHQQLDHSYELGLKKPISKYNQRDLEIPADLDGQKVLLDKRLAAGYYRDFQAIKQDFHLLFVSNRKLCKNLWDEYHPIQTLDVKPLRVIWLYGASGAGKSYWTNDYIKSLGYSSADVCCKSYEGVDKVWFNLADEGKKVLWIEEVREDFPNNNKLIKIIDRKDWLPVKGSQIRNTFKLLIINSLAAPEKVYCHLKEGNQIEVLRRIYLGDNNQVYYVKRIFNDSDNHNQVIDVTKKIPAVLRDHLQLQSD
jgi:hypothetical protein